MKQKTIALCLAVVMILAAIPLGVFAMELPAQTESTASEENSLDPTETPIEESSIPSEVPPTAEPEPTEVPSESSTILPVPEATPMREER